MAALVEYSVGDCLVRIIVDERANENRAQKANVSDVLGPAITKASVTLSDAVESIGHVAGAFTATLAKADPKPKEIEIEFGLEAAAEGGMFLISKVAGKANFSVKMNWSF